jgi:hypothetical protein
MSKFFFNSKKKDLVQENRFGNHQNLVEIQVIKCLKRKKGGQGGSRRRAS